MCFKKQKKKRKSLIKIGGKQKKKRKFVIKDRRKARKRQNSWSKIGGKQEKEKNSRSKIRRKQKRNIQKGHQSGQCLNNVQNCHKQERKDKQTMTWDVWSNHLLGYQPNLCARDYLIPSFAIQKQSSPMACKDCSGHLLLLFWDYQSPLYHLEQQKQVTTTVFARHRTWLSLDGKTGE